MGILSKLFHGSSNETETSNTTNTSAPTSNETPIPTTASGVQLLDLNKGDILDLTKYSESLKKIRAAAGWNINERYGSDYDLDLCAYLCTPTAVDRVVYYGHKNEKGIFLDGDNLTGSSGGENDDENIYVELDEISHHITKIIFAVVIYEASSRHQCFDKVQNAYMRLIDRSNEKEICRYRLSNDGGKNTAAVLAQLTRGMDGNWSFQAIGDYYKDSIGTLKNHVLD